MKRKNDFQQFIDQHKDDTETRRANFTKDQIRQIERFGKTLGLPFEDMVMLLVHLQFNDIAAAYINQSSVKN